MLGMEKVPDDVTDIDQKVDNKYLNSDDERKQMHLARKMNQKGQRSTALYFQVGFSTSFSGKDSGSSQWIFGKSMGCAQGRA